MRSSPEGLPAQTIAAGTPLLIVAGLLTGFGAVWGSGCTSGHGVCGLSRLSLRSLVATIDLHVGGHRDCLRDAALGLTTMTILVQFAIGLVFGLGLIVSGMSNPAKVLNFLDVGGIPAGTWDASLAFVMAGAVAVTFIGFSRVLKLAHLSSPNAFTFRRERTSIQGSSPVPPSSASAGGSPAFVRARR